MKFRRIYLKFLIVFLIIAGLIVFFPRELLEEEKSLPTEACFREDLCIDLELAISEQEKAYGLMNRKELPDDSGMLFLSNDMQLKKFWMKNTLIPLDIIWLDGNNKIIYIEKNAPPCEEDPCPTYGLNALSKNVIEVNGGFTIRNNINVGDVVEIK